MTLPIILITGVTGQIGSYFAEYCLAKGHRVHGIVRRSSSFNTSRLESIYRDPHDASSRFHLHFSDLQDGSSLRRVISIVKPDWIVNLAAQSHVKVSFDVPEYTADVTGLGAIRLFEAAREVFPLAKILQASSSEMFGSSPPPQSETTRFHPRSPYAIAKLMAYWAAVNEREAYGQWLSNCINFNVESPRRGETFVTRKITKAAARIKLGLQDKLYLGNLSARRDWNYVMDTIEAMYLILSQDKPDDFVVASGESHSVKDFLDVAFGLLDLDWEKHVEIDPRYFRPSEVENLRGDSSKIRKALGWVPKVRFEELVKIMVMADLDTASKESAS